MVTTRSVCCAVLVVGFDLDMTLVDSRPGIRASLAALSSETGVDIDADIVIGRLGPKLEWELAHWFPETEVGAMADAYRRHYWAHCIEGTILLPGATESVADVRARGGRVLVVTAKAEPHARRCIDAVGLDVDVVVGFVHGDEKRDALADHGARVYVGDTTTDVRSAIDAGALAVGVATGPDSPDALEHAGADVVLSSLTELPAWLDSRIAT